MTYLDIGAAIDIFDGLRHIDSFDEADPNFSSIGAATNIYDYLASITNIVRWLVKLGGETLDLPDAVGVALMFAQIIT
jgi:hypothetical protein